MNLVLRLLAILITAGLAGATWFADSWLVIGSQHPLEPLWIRATLVAVLSALVVLQLVFVLRSRRSGRITAVSLGGKGLDEEMRPRIEAVVAKLKGTSGKRDFLYQVPWYVVIGPPAAGKTAALANSGLNLVLSGSANDPQATGRDATRSCDWWLGEDAVWIDTPGGYAIQDGEKGRDRQGWLSLLALLKAYRPVQPLNGVILALDLSDLASQASNQRGGWGDELRRRLGEVREALRIDVPVYVLFTKADRIAGFKDYFAGLDEAQRRRAWGATLAAADRSAVTVPSVPPQFDALAQRLSEILPDQLQATLDPARRAGAFGFPAHFAALRPDVVGMLAALFEGRGQTAAPLLRGFYFSSPAPEAAPAGQASPPLARGRDRRASSFFLHDVLADVVIPERGWASRDAAGPDRVRSVRRLSFGVIGLGCAAALGCIGFVYYKNHVLLSAAAAGLAQYQASADPTLAETRVSDVNLENVLAGLDALRSLPGGYATRAAPAAVEEALGLGERQRLLGASVEVYRQALERHLRSRLLLQMEQTVRANIADPVTLYEPLKVYLMLGGKAPRSDDAQIIAWLRRDWERNRYPGASNRQGREDLEDHLRAMLALGQGHDPTFELDKTLIETAQRSLGRLSIADQASTLLKASLAASVSKPFSVAEDGGAQASLVFEATDGGDLDSLSVPGIYTFEGFHAVYLPALSNVAERLVAERWVIGSGGEQGDVAPELQRIGPDLLDRYNRDFLNAWNGMLDRLKLKPMAAGKPDYLALSAVASSQSPIVQLFEAVAAETALARTRAISLNAGVPDDAELAKGLAGIGIEIATSKSQVRAGVAFDDGEADIPGAAVESQFRPYQLLVTGTPGQRPIDAVVQNFKDIYKSLMLANSAPSQSERLAANLQLQVATLRSNATRLPKALATMVRAAADDFEDNAAQASIQQLDRVLTDTVTTPCQKAVTGRFPFESSNDDMPMRDFATLFAPNGIIDRFSAQYLSPLLDTSGQSWQWKADSKLARGLSKAALKSFQDAADIRDAFFPVGSSVPGLDIVITPLSLDNATQSALLTIDGQTIQSRQSGNAAVTLNWPDGNAEASASLSLSPAMPGRTSQIDFAGDWALKRLMDGASVTPKDNADEVHFIIGGRDAVYQFQFKPAGNPFALPALSSFRCPTSF